MSLPVSRCHAPFSTIQMFTGRLSAVRVSLRLFSVAPSIVSCFLVFFTPFPPVSSLLELADGGFQRGQARYFRQGRYSRRLSSYVAAVGFDHRPAVSSMTFCSWPGNCGILLTKQQFIRLIPRRRASHEFLFSRRRVADGI